MIEKIITGHVCIFDEETYTKYSMYGLSVCTKPDGYRTLVFSSGPFKTRYYSRVIMEAPRNLEVDHIDGNSLNNHKDNLRLVTSQQNKFNTKKRNNGTLPKGVTKHGRFYKATITTFYITKCLGTYPTPEEAGEVYKKAAEEKFGKFALHNSR